ncbi:hypothetical protein PVAND_004767 [Polypedilum vanderplanki]|uniref:Uncharacterized protein n=1 Tax=Polypedilum vanderplanki TaxID=319348 RepID=A0A9J6BY61_POLVA|nr:hypothetical protein PVAND_004767 [Polypedilum vanderplanki]
MPSNNVKTNETQVIVKKIGDNKKHAGILNAPKVCTPGSRPNNDFFQTENVRIFEKIDIAGEVQSGGADDLGRLLKEEIMREFDDFEVDKK